MCDMRIRIGTIAIAIGIQMSHSSVHTSIVVL